MYIYIYMYVYMYLNDPGLPGSPPLQGIRSAGHRVGWGWWSSMHYTFIDICTCSIYEAISTENEYIYIYIYISLYIYIYIYIYIIYLYTHNIFVYIYIYYIYYIYSCWFDYSFIYLLIYSCILVTWGASIPFCLYFVIIRIHRMYIIYRGYISIQCIMCIYIYIYMYPTMTCLTCSGTEDVAWADAAKECGHFGGGAEVAAGSQSVPWYIFI